MSRFASALKTQGNVTFALILRDMQTRFGGSYVNYLVALGWPLAHIGILLVVYTLAGRVAPAGTSVVMFFATGLTPYMFFQYPARFMMMSLVTNKPLLAFPIVKILDVLLARAILETVSGFAVICITAFVLYASGFDVIPRDPVMAVAALSAMWCLAVGIGLLNAVIASIFPAWMIGFLLLQILIYVLSGILFVTSALPEGVQYVLSWNPALHGVEWFRAAYYEGYATSAYVPDRLYPYIFGLVCTFLAMVSERFLLRRTVQA